MDIDEPKEDESNPSQVVSSMPTIKLNPSLPKSKKKGITPSVLIEMPLPLALPPQDNDDSSVASSSSLSSTDSSSSNSSSSSIEDEDEDLWNKIQKELEAIKANKKNKLKDPPSEGQNEAMSVEDMEESNDDDSLPSLMHYDDDEDQLNGNVNGVTIPLIHPKTKDEKEDKNETKEKLAVIQNRLRTKQKTCKTPKKLTTQQK
jgi:hypothetical protein